MATAWGLFCGTNQHPDANFSQTETSVNWHDNTCLVNGVATIPHAAFLLLASLLLLILGCFTSYCRVHTKFLLTYPGHSVRWLVSVLLLVIILASIGEGFMTDERYQAWDNPTQPHLYIHSIVAFIAVVISLVYYHHMELWQCPSMSLPLLIYWLFCVTNEILRLLSLESQGLVDVHIVIFDVTVLKLASYLFLLVLELLIIWTKVLGYRHSAASDYTEDFKEFDMKYLQYNVSLFSSLLFWWVNWLLKLGYRKHLELDDLGVVPKRHTAKTNHERFRKVFIAETEKAERTGKQVSLSKVYMLVYGRAMLFALFLKVMGELLDFVCPLAVGPITVYVENIRNGVVQTSPAHHVTVTEFFSNGFILVSVMFLTGLASSFCQQMHFYITVVKGMDAGAALQTMVYEKTLRLSTVAMSIGDMSAGQITNHMSVDQDAVQFMFQNIILVCSAPIQLVVTLILLYLKMGFAALIGVSLFILVTPVQILITQYQGQKQKKLMKYADERLKNTNELLQGIKLLKMYAWEELYCKAVEFLRGKELDFLFKIQVGYITTMCLTHGTPIFVTILGFGTYGTLTGDPLTPAVTFTALSLFNVMYLPMVMLPVGLLYVINGVVSTKRLQKFLAAPEIEDQSQHEAFLHHGNGINGISHKNSTTDDYINGDAFTEKTRLIKSEAHVSYNKEAGTTIGPQIGTQRHQVNSLREGVAIKITNGIFVWDSTADLPVLSNINLEIPEGKLTVVIGRVGSGKTSLISAILGEMTTVCGTVQVRDRNRIAFAAQKPWLMNETLQENVLFSRPLHKKRYNRVLAACALKFDIDILPAGDQTEIGEKGLNMSGGQKQRISVARAVYSGRNIVILDDPLSALDVHVGTHLFNEGIQKFLLSHNQTVVLVTHQLQYLNRADLIIKMEDGRIAAKGTLDDIISIYPDVFTEYNQAVKMVTESEVETATGMSGYESESMREDRLLLQKQVKEERHRTEGETSDVVGSLMEKEDMERGSVSFTVYFYYATNFGLGMALVVVVLCALFTASEIAASFWLSKWAESGLRNNTTPESQIDEFLGMFVLFEMVYFVFCAISRCLIVLGFFLAAKRVHQKMLRNIIGAPLRFFDTVPVGRIMNRFSNDVGQIDWKLARSYLIVIHYLLSVVAAVIVNTIVIPIFIVVFLPIIICYFVLQWYFLASSRELQRLNSISKSPVLAFFSESLAGLTTIRAYRATSRFYNSLTERINRNLSAFLYLQIVIRWVCIRLDLLGKVVILVAGMATLAGALMSDISSSLVGLAISYSLQVSMFLNYLVRYMAEIEMQMNGVERIKHYTEVDNENYEGIEPPPDWPETGHIVMENVSVRYAKNTDTVLRDITLDIKDGQKVGICGRTGAGKSSLTLALLRVIDIFQGRVLIDGVDITSVPLRTLRGSLSIIPQDPVLFTGTIRRNLDPLSSFVNTDDDLWRALEIAQLKDIVSQLNGGLDFLVTEGGENFSVGQRQLFCLARAFLRKSKILVMDEATASMDLETDKTLQGVVDNAFADKTVLTIAHRISTILNSDSILVLDEGKVAEYGHPDTLLEMDGIFASFVHNKDM